MGFIDSYKKLEKLCGEILNDSRCISAYIDEMKTITNGSYYVATWNEDLKKLKHYRWVRNQISHEPGCTEQNMCEIQDKLWLDNFYSRIINQTDPLSLYHKAMNRGGYNTTPKYVPKSSEYTSTYKRPNVYQEYPNGAGCLSTFTISLFVIVGIFILLLQII